MSKASCKVEGCEEPAYVGGRCRAHYLALKHLEANPLYRRPETCTVDGCTKPHSSNGLCEAHYKRLLRYGSPTYKPPLKNGGKCSVDGCEQLARTSGMCVTHSRRQRNTGTALPGKPMLTAEQVKYIQDSRGMVTSASLAAACGTTIRTVVAIQAGRLWGFLK